MYIQDFRNIRFSQIKRCQCNHHPTRTTWIHKKQINFDTDDPLPIQNF